MAVLTLDSLLGCNSIPDFLGSGNITMFHNSTAPTSWTKLTTGDNLGLRVIGGANGTALSPGGTFSFTQTFAVRTTTAPSSSDNAGAYVDTRSYNYQSPSPFTVQSTSDTATLTSDQIPSHTHRYAHNNPSGTPGTQGNPSYTNVAAGSVGPETSAGVNPVQRVNGHSHTIYANHSHPINQGGHDHSLSSSGPHSHSITTSQDFSIAYVDIIRASKN